MACLFGLTGSLTHQITAACQLPGAENEWNVPSQEGVEGGGNEAWAWEEPQSQHS